MRRRRRRLLITVVSVPITFGGELAAVIKKISSEE